MIPTNQNSPAPQKPDDMSDSDYGFMMNKRDSGVSFADSKAALIKAKKGLLQETSPTVAGALSLGSAPMEMAMERKDEKTQRADRIEEIREESPTVATTLKTSTGILETKEDVKNKHGLTDEQMGQYTLATQSGMSENEAVDAVKDPAVGTEFLKGAGKQALETGVKGSEMFQKYAAKPFVENVTDMEMAEVETPEALEKFYERTNTAQKVGALAEQIAEFAIPGVGAAKAAKVVNTIKGIKGAKAIGMTMLFEGLTGAGVASVQEGEVGKEAAIAGGLSAAIPGVGGLLGKIFKPTRLMQKALGITRGEQNQLNILVKGIKNSKGEQYYDDIGDFALKNNMTGTRETMKESAEELFEQARASKAPLLQGIKNKVPNKYGELFEYLEKKYAVPGQKSVLDKVSKLKGKKNLTASELEEIRVIADATLPTGAYKGAEPVATRGAQNMIDKVRSTLAGLDKTGAYKKANADIRILYKLIGEGQKTGFLTKAAEKNLVGSLMGRSAFTSGMAALPLIMGNPTLATIAAAVGGIDNVLLNIPIVSSTLATTLNKMPKTAASEIIADLMKAGLKEASTEVVD